MLIYVEQQGIIKVVFHTLGGIFHGLSALFRNQYFLYSHTFDNFGSLSDFSAENRRKQILYIGCRIFRTHDSL